MLKQNESDIESITRHFVSCNPIFLYQLEKKVDLKAYTKKLYEKSDRFECWSGRDLIGLLAAYFNCESRKAFVTNISVSSQFLRMGIATKLMRWFLDYAQAQCKVDSVSLMVHKENNKAIMLYSSFGFASIGSYGDELQLTKILV